MKKWLTLLSLLLTLICTTAFAEEITDTQGDMLIAENERYALYLTYKAAP